jgi:prepilin-type N-terminal cleavage/methylation domain-containing protein
MFSVNSMVKRLRRKGDRGFTLIELMIALAALGILLTAIYRVFSTQDRMFRNQEQISSLQENLRSTVEYINQELTWMGYQVPGLSVLRAAETDLIFKANIPNSGTTIQYVRYRFDANTNTISRAAGDALSDVTGSMAIMANDIAGLSFSYINVLNAVLTATDAAPLVADELGGTDDASLLMIQRVKARVTARTTRPDNFYTHPATASTATPWGGDAYRTRSAVLDLKARNAEDVTLQGGQVGLGSCGYLEHTITVPGGNYVACPDKKTALTSGTAAINFSDNPYVTINAFDKDGNINTNASRVTYVFASAHSDQTPYDFFDASNPGVQDNVIDSGETLHMAAANTVTNVSDGETVNIRFAYNDGLCTQTTYTGSTTVQIAAGVASHINSTSPYPLELAYEKISDGTPLTLPEPVQIPLCSSVEDVGIRFTTSIIDDCDNAIAGETVVWDDDGNSGTINDTDNGDGTYTMLYEPPGNLGSVSPTFSIPITVTWGAESYSHNLTLGPGAAYDIIIDSISEPAASSFNFSGNVPNANQQRSSNDPSSFSIDRVDGKDVLVTFHLEDECENWIFNEVPNLSVTPTIGQTTAITETSGTYSFIWRSDEGCGGEMPGQNLTINSISIADATRKTEVIDFDLNETRSGPDAGPWLNFVADPDQFMVAGDTSDSTLVTASIMKYSTTQERCSNIPGAFNIDLELQPDSSSRTGSFSDATPFDDTTRTVTTAGGTGEVDFTVYTGMAQWNDTFILVGNADVAGASYQSNLGFVMKPSEPGASSGLYSDALYTNRVGVAQPDRGYDPGDTIYVQIFDFDENEDPTAVDSQSGPEYVEVTLESLRTGDEETIRLTETNPNTALFQANISSEFNSSDNDGDGTLQVLFGDFITVYYEDRNDASENETWQAYTGGPSNLVVYKYHSAVATSLITGSGLAQTPSLEYGDKIQPVLYLPIMENDTSVETDTIVLELLSGSGDDADTLVMREEGDTGYFYPDWYIYTGKFFTVTQSDPTDAAHLLGTPTSPRFVTITYDEPGVTVEQTSVFVKDGDPPTVTITAPGELAVVGSDVTVTVAVEDVDNATADAGISQIDLIINGIVVQTISGGDLSPSQDFTWTTRVGVQPLWLDGDHTLTARAWDNALNDAYSTGVDVELDNNLRAIEFLYPGFSDVFSDTVTVGVQVVPLDPAFALSDVYLAVEGDNRPLTNIGGGVYEYNLDTNAETEGPIILVAYVKDQFGNINDSAQLDIVVDRTPPEFNLGTPPPWVTRAEFPINNDVMITEVSPNMVDTSSVTTTFSGVCNSPINMPYISATGSTYTFFWDGDTGTSCIAGAGVEGPITWSVHAADMASPANTISRSVMTTVDTMYPVMDSLISVTPLQSPAFTIDLGVGTVPVAGFVKDTVLASTNVSDSWPSAGTFSVQYYQDPGVPWADSTWGTAQTTPPIDASTGTFSWMWTTNGGPMYYPSGVYYVRADATDQAGNANAAPSETLVYVDNSPPWINAPEPMPNWPARSKVDFRYEADAQFGFLKAVAIRIYRQADVFGPGWPDNHIDEIVEIFPLADKKRHVMGLMQWDTTLYPEGQYESWGFASDWADNVISSGWGQNFQISQKYFTGESYNFSAVCDSTSLPTPCVPTEYELTDVSATIMSGVTPAPGTTVLVYVNSNGMIGSVSSSYSYTIRTWTDPLGNFSVNIPPYPPVSPPDYFQFPEDWWAYIDIYHVDVNENWNWLGYMYGQVPGDGFIHPSFWTYQPSLVTTSGNYMDLTGTAPGPYTVNVGGELYSPAGPALGYTVQINMDVWDGFTNNFHTEMGTTSIVDGTWSFSVDPFEVMINDGYQINYIEIFYWKDGSSHYLGRWDGQVPDGPFWAWFN